MSKMRMPEMSVVRFQESDVIVASSLPNSVKFAHFSDGEKANGTVTYGGTTYGWPSTSGSGMESIFDSSLYGSGRGVQAYSGSGYYEFNTLLSGEATDGYEAPNGVKDGYYTWNAGSSTYEYSHQ